MTQPQLIRAGPGTFAGTLEEKTLLCPRAAGGHFSTLRAESLPEDEASTEESGAEKILASFLGEPNGTNLNSSSSHRMCSCTLIREDPARPEAHTDFSVTQTS